MWILPIFNQLPFLSSISKIFARMFLLLLLLNLTLLPLLTLLLPTLLLLLRLPPLQPLIFLLSVLQLFNRDRLLFPSTLVLPNSPLLLNFHLQHWLLLVILITQISYQILVFHCLFFFHLCTFSGAYFLLLPLLRVLFRTVGYTRHEGYSQRALNKGRLWPLSIVRYEAFRFQARAIYLSNYIIQCHSFHHLLGTKALFSYVRWHVQVTEGLQFPQPDQIFSWLSRFTMPGSFLWVPCLVRICYCVYIGSFSHCRC